jgi:hypothetical protein
VGAIVAHGASRSIIVAQESGFAVIVARLRVRICTLVKAFPKSGDMMNGSSALTLGVAC